MAANDPEKKNVEEIVRRYLDWLDSEIDIAWTYHNHKETMAWVATAAYFSIPGLAYAAAPFSNWFAKIGLCVVLVALACAAYLFVNTQFQMRWEAADRGRGLRRVKAKLCKISTYDDYEELAKLKTEQFLKTPKRTPGKKAIEYPTFIMDEIEYAKTTPQTLRRVWRLLYLTALKAPKRLNSNLRKINARTRSELASYLILSVITLASIIAVLFSSHCPEAGVVSTAHKIGLDTSLRTV